MILNSKLINYATNFLESEIEQIEKLLEKHSTSENDKKLLSRLLDEYKMDLKELE
ncbi:hypothetical protein ACGCUP_00965 [Eubacteriales bacterium KG125]